MTGKKFWVCVALALALALAGPAQGQVLDRIVAVVNDDVVLQSELSQELAAVRAQLARQDTPMPSEGELRRQVLERLVLQKLQLNAAERMGISVDDATLDAAVRRVAERNRLSLIQFRNALRSEGMTMAGFRDRLREEIIVSRLQQREMQRRVNVTPQEIEQFLEQNRDRNSEYRLSHILIAAPEAASPQALQQARQQAEQVRQQLTNGANFATMAATWSDGRNALEGGDLGWRSGGELPSIIADQAAQMEPGDITRVMRSPSGFHLFRLTDRREAERHIETQTHARHILIETNAVVSDRDARLRLQSLRERIENGESFAELARANSDDKGSASQGGDLGWISPGSMIPSFEQRMDSLQPDELSRPFRTRYGWHLVQVEGRREQDTTEEFRRNQAAQQLQQRKQEEELEVWLRELREESYVDYRLQA